MARRLPWHKQILVAWGSQERLRRTLRSPSARVGLYPSGGPLTSEHPVATSVSFERLLVCLHLTSGKERPPSTSPGISAQHEWNVALGLFLSTARPGQLAPSGLEMANGPSQKAASLGLARVGAGSRGGQHG